MAAGAAGLPALRGLGESPGTGPSPPAERPRVRRQRGRFLVWSPAAARALRERHRVWGALVGTPPRRGAAAAAAGRRLPLQLRPEEARALRESGGAAVEPVERRAGGGRGRGAAAQPVRPQVGEAGAEPEEEEEEEEEDEDEDEDGAAPRRFRLFRALWRRGLHLTPGGKFGGDFLVYPGPPAQFHAGAVALCPRSSRAQPLGALLAAARLGASVRKALLLCAAPPGGALTCTALTWRADLT